jgi:hypothetical protein
MQKNYIKALAKDPLIYRLRSLQPELKYSKTFIFFIDELKTFSNKYIEVLCLVSLE